MASHLFGVGLVVGVMAGAAGGADVYDFTLTQASSTASFDVNASAPFSGAMMGNTTATPATRTKVGTFRLIPPGVNCSNFTAGVNEPVNISGAITASGQNSSIRPTGAFRLTIDPVAGSSAVEGLSLNLLGGSTASVTASLSNLTYQNFCAVDPACQFPFLIPISFAAGNVVVTALTVQQGAGAASGSLVAGGNPGTFTFSIPMTVQVSAAAAFSGAALPTAPQTVPIVFGGTITVNGLMATVTNMLEVDFSPPASTTPVELPATPFTVPPESPFCGGANLLLMISVNSTTVSVEAGASIVAAGMRVVCPCDWNGAGGLTLQDLFDFLGGYFGGMGDYNRDGGTTIQDVFDFLGCYFSRPAGC